MSRSPLDKRNAAPRPFGGQPDLDWSGGGGSAGGAGASGTWGFNFAAIPAWVYFVGAYLVTKK